MMAFLRDEIPEALARQRLSLVGDRGGHGG
jgi:hypothetical protein